MLVYCEFKVVFLHFLPLLFPPLFSLLLLCPKATSHSLVFSSELVYLCIPYWSKLFCHIFPPLFSNPLLSPSCHISNKFIQERDGRGRPFLLRSEEELWAFFYPQAEVRNVCHLIRNITCWVKNRCTTKGTRESSFLSLVQKQHTNCAICVYLNLHFHISLLLLTKTSFLHFQLMERAVFKDSECKTRREWIVHASAWYRPL